TFIGTVDADGNYAIDVPGALLADNDSITAEVTGSDDAGNPYRADAERDYSVNLSGEAEISIDPIAGDGVINGDEAQGNVTITGTVGGDANQGDTVTLTVGGETFTGEVGEDLTYAIDVPGSLLADNDSVTAEVTGSDAAGNPYRADAERGYSVDLEATATITIDIIAGDGVVNGEEAEGDVTITGTVGGDASQGDTVTLTVGGETFTGEVGEDLTYAIDVPGALLADNDSITAEVTGSDAAGNPYRADAERDYSVNLSGEAEISIDPIAGDGVVNGEEAEGDVTITGTVGGDASQGDTVTLTVGGETFTGEVGEDLTYAIDVPGSLLAEHDSVTAEVTGSDDAGNPYRADAERGYGVDLEATATITIDIIAGDGVVNGEEAEGDVTITGTVGGDASQGDTVTLTVGGETFSGEVGEDLTYAIDVPGSLLADNDSVTAEVTGSDAAGNPYRADAQRGYGVDLEATATITIDPIAGDGVVNGEEAEADVTITGTVGGDASQGDTVTLTVGGETFSGEVGEDLTYAIDVPGSLLADNDSVTAEVTGSDAAGNPYRADAERDYSVNLSGEAEITIDPIAGDGVINGDEAQGNVTITGTVGGDASQGDTVTLTVGGETFTGEVGEDLTYAIDVPGALLAEHDSVTAEVTGSDAAGNPYRADAERGYDVVPDIVHVGAVDSDVDNITVEEGDSAEFTVKLSNASPHETTYSLQLSSGTATQGEDFSGELTFSDGVIYDSGTGQITVPAGVTEFIVTVATVDDNLVESTETFTLTVGGVTATGTILDNDTFSVTSVLEASDQDVNGNQDDNPETDIVYKGNIEGEFSPDVTLAIDGSNASGLTSNGESIGYSWNADAQTLTASTDSGVVFIVTLDPPNSEYVYQQFQAIDHPDIAGADHSLDIPLTLVALDASGNVITDSEFTITVFDDAPVVSGNLAIETENDGDFATSGYLSQATLSNDLTSVSWNTDGLPQLVFDGLLVNYVDHGDGMLTGELDDGTLVFRVQIDTSQANADNNPHYSFELLNSFGKLGAEEDAKGYTEISGGNSENYVVSFGDFLINSMTSTAIDGKSGETVVSTVNSNSSWIGVGGNWFNPGEKLTMGFADPGDNPGQVRGMELSVQGSGNSPKDSYTLHWEATGVDAQGDSVTWSGTFDGSSNKATDFTIPLDAGAAYFSTLVVTAVSGDFRIGLSGVVANNYNDDIPLDLAYTLTDADGDTAEGGIDVILTGPATSPDGPANPDTLPEAAGGQVEGSEDTALVLQWQDFNITADSPGASLGIVITELPEAGVLHFNVAGEWTAVSVGDQFTKADIDGGNLRFMPEANASGFDGYGGNGVGNQQADYAQVKFKPTDGHNVGEEATLVIDIEPVADAPDVSLMLTPGETHGGSAEIIKVNGGSEVAGGFDVQDGQIVRIGDNVRVWLTKGDSTPGIANPGSDNAGVIAFYEQGNHGGEGQYADIFVVHSNSGWFYTQSDWDHEELRGLDSVHGNRMEDDQNAYGDYIFVMQEEGFEYQVGWSTNNNADTHVNTLDGVWVGYTNQSGSGSLINQVSNNLDGVIFGDGSYATPNAPEIETVPGGDAYQEFLIELAAQLVDTDGSEILSDITLTGIPAGASIELVTAPDGVSVESGADGSWVLTNPDLTALTDLTLLARVPLEDADTFSVVARTTAKEVIGLDDAGEPIVVDSVTTVAGSDGDDILIGGSGNDVLIGGLGDDVFQWNLGDQGSDNDPAKDVVKDFSVGENVLDLADLLQGESADSLGSFVFAEQVGEDTLLHIKHDGGLAADGSNADQMIVLEGYGMEGKGSEEFLQFLLEHNQLNIDS
ncbi:Ig-like domain-containing protein, partial [Billgrantia sp. Q4P2]|uniref:Ig-like domain-containing protein n=1 Tax=Billgrantia sp. Q4P2 TaxID=3463857 RepID=UPI004056996D